jgi:hypothetical protein
MFRTGSAMLDGILSTVAKQQLASREDRVDEARQQFDSCSVREMLTGIADLQAQQYRDFDLHFGNQPKSNFSMTIRAALAQWAADITRDESR